MLIVCLCVSFQPTQAYARREKVADESVEWLDVIAAVIPLSEYVTVDVLTGTFFVQYTVISLIKPALGHV